MSKGETMLEENAKEAAPPVICAYCKHHRWCSACNVGYTEGDTCKKCDAALEAPPVPVNMPPLFEGAKVLTEQLHQECSRIVAVLREHQALLGMLSGHAHRPYDAVLRRVVNRKFTGWLDMRLVLDEKRPNVVEARVQMMLRAPKEPRRNGWASVWISPDFVDLIHKGMDLGAREASQKEKADGAPDLDVDVSAQLAANETSEDLS